MRLPMIMSAILWGSVTMADAPRVATDIAPVHSLVAQVMEGVGAPDLIVRPDASPHGYAMRPSEAAALAEADLVVWVGPELTPWLAGSIDTLGVDAAQIVLLEAEETRLLPLREGIAFEIEHDDHDEHDDHGDDHDHDQEHIEGHDPHAWLDPVNAQAWLRVIAAELSVLDTENAETYQANAERGIEDLNRLMGEVERDLTAARGIPFLVMHDAYQYFETRFDLPAVSAISLGDASRPGAARLDELRELSAERGVACVLHEPQFETRITGAILGDEVTRSELDPIGAAQEPGAGHYAALIRAMAAGFAACAG